MPAALGADWLTSAWDQNGGGYVALHAANDSMHTWQFPTGGPLWYQELLGGLFVSHPANQNGFGTDCGSCYWVEVVTEEFDWGPSRAPWFLRLTKSIGRNRKAIDATLARLAEHFGEPGER